MVRKATAPASRIATVISCQRICSASHLIATTNPNSRSTGGLNYATNDLVSVNASSSMSSSSFTRAVAERDCVAWRD